MMKMLNTVSRQRGMTLIELMVSMVIGLFLVLGAVTVYTQGRANYTANEGIARLQENLRFAMDVLEPDIRLAGFWGMHSADAAVNPNGLAVTCDGGDVTNWVFDPQGTGAGPTGLRAFNNIQAGGAGFVAPGCPAFDDGIAVNTDVLEIRRASSQPAAMVPGQMLMQSGIDGSTVFNDGALPLDFVDVDPLRMNTFGLVVNSWYISNGSNGFDGVPSLRRRTLRNGVMVDEEVIAGVENMQIQLGIDTDLIPDDNVDQYVDPDDPLAANNPVIAVRIWMLIRATDEERGFVDGGQYAPLDDALAPIEPDDSFRRLQVSKTIFLRNARTT